MNPRAQVDLRKKILLDYMRRALVAIQKHPLFNVDHPQNPTYSLYYLWEYLHRTCYMLNRIDFAQLYVYDEQAMGTFDAVEYRVGEAQQMLRHCHIEPIDCNDEIWAAGAQLEPSMSLSGFIRDSVDSLSDSVATPLIEHKPEAEGARRDMPRGSRCLLMELPREMRDHIYRYLVSTDYTKTPPATLDSSNFVRFQWALHTAILCVSKEILNEARELMGRENRFVVLERATQHLTQSMDQKQDGAFPHRPDYPIWPGRAKSEVRVPGEVMRITFSRPNVAKGGVTDYFVCLPEELRDVLVKLGLFRIGGVLRTRGLSCAITLTTPQSSETEATTKRRESALLDPLTKLRQLSNVTITGASDEKAQDTIQQMEREEFSAEDVLHTVDELLGTVDAYTRAGSYNIARTYSDWCTLVLNIFDSGLSDAVSVTDGYSKGFYSRLLRIVVKKALCCMKSGLFEHAYAKIHWSITRAHLIPEFRYPVITFEDNGRGLRKYQQKVPDSFENGDMIEDADLLRACCYYRLAADFMGAPVPWDTVAVVGSDHDPLVIELRTLIRDLEERWGERNDYSLRWVSTGGLNTNRVVWKRRDIPSYDKEWRRPLGPLIESGEAAHLESVDLRL